MQLTVNISYSLQVSVVRQSQSDVTGSDTDDSSAKGIFGRKKKKKKTKKDEGQTALVFSFSNTDFTKNFSDLAQEAIASNVINENNRVSSIGICHEQLGTRAAFVAQR